jgi:hypothetical protein
MKPKYIEDHDTEKCELEIYECQCGFHIGVDATFLGQMTDPAFKIVCPSCGNGMTFEAFDEEEAI